MKKVFTLTLILLLIPRLTLACAGGGNAMNNWWILATTILLIILNFFVLRNKSKKFKLFVTIGITIFAFIAFIINSAMQNTLCGTNTF